MANPTFRAALLAGCLGGLLIASSPAQAANYTATLSVTVSGTTVTYQVTACSEKGKGDSFKLGLWYHQTTSLTCNPATLPNKEWVVPALGPGACQSFTDVRTAVPVGSYTARAYADFNCALVETAEYDNQATFVYSLQPELSGTVYATVTGTTVTYTMSVKNTGIALTTPFNVGLYYNRTTAPVCGDAPDVSFPVASMAAGETLPLTHTKADLATGYYRAYIFVDQGCVITEGNEYNTSYSTYYLGPNVYVYTPTVTVSGTTVTYSVMVCPSYATSDMPAYSVGLFYNRSTAPTCGTTGADHTWNETGLPKATGCKTLTHTTTTSLTGTLTAWVFADLPCTVAESKEDDNVRSRLYVVGAASPLDLYISSFTATPTGTDVSYKTTVCNQGGTAAGMFTVGLAYNAAAAPACGGTFDASTTVLSLGAGLCTTWTHLRTGVAPGGYTAWVLADSACALTAETSKTNNSKSAGYTLGQPDITVGNFSAAVTGSQAVFTAQVCNTGTAAAGAFAVGVYSDRTTAPDCTMAPSFTLPVSALAGGACATVTATDPAVATGNKQAWVLADHLCQILEGSETNNTKSYNYGVGVDAPDLKVTSFPVNSSGTTVVYVSVVCNTGTAAALASDLGIYYDRAAAPSCDDEPDWSATLPGLAPGECETRTHIRENATGGTYKAWARADSACAIGESDETNNITSSSYTVAAPTQTVDLTISALNIWVTDDRVTMVATICNQGVAKAADNTAGIFFDRSEAPKACQDTPDAKQLVPALDPGACKDVTFVRQKVAVGSYTTWVLADTDCVVGESDENNNAKSKPYTIGSTTPTEAGGPQPTDAGPVEGGTLEPPAPPPLPKEGCGCEVPGGGGGAASGLALLLGLMLVAGARRRRRR